MTTPFQDHVRELAEPLWRSAAQPYGLAMEFWLMAEQMVQELVSASTRFQLSLAKQPPPFMAAWLPEATPVARIRELALCMWEAAGDQYGAAQDFWLAAERHVLTAMRAASATAHASATPSWVQEIATLTPQAYLDRIRANAYYIWERTGQRYGTALDHWLAAEQEMLKAMAAYARGVEEGRAAIGGHASADDELPRPPASGARPLD